MSRIDEALKRAATQVSAVDTPTVIHRDRFSIPARPLIEIDDYAEEPVIASAARAPLASPATQRPMERSRERLGASSSITQAGAVSPGSIATTARLVSDPTTARSAVSQYRRLAASLHKLQSEQGLKLVMVASAVPGEGKTLTAVNLALTLSTSYQRRVLLVDADLRQPGVHDVCGVSNAVGLANALRGEHAGLLEVGPYLTVLPAGKADAKALSALVSEQMHTVIDEVVPRFDWVILDTPPIDTVPDSQMLATLVQGVVLVLGAHSTSYKVVEKSIAAIGRERVIGTVLNRSQADDSKDKKYERYEYTE